MFSIRTSEIKYVFQRFVEPDLESHHANRVNFIYELHRARGLKFSDDRDRIFAWLGHFSARMTNQELSAMEADYQSTEAQVYTDVAVRALKGDIDNGNGLALITLAAVQHMDLQCGSKVSLQDGIEMQVPVKDTLPTWVPDWRTYQSFILSEPISPFCAHGGSLPKLDIDEKRRLLRIWGLKVDMIENCSQVLSDKEFHMKADPANAQPAVETIWRDICRHDSFTLRVKYVNGQDSLFACMQTLSNGGMQAAGREKRPYHEIPISWWLEEQAMYLVKIFGQSDVVAPDVRKLAKRAGSERKDEQWSRLATGASKNRKFARTLSGYYVLGPQVMEAGDVICVLFGGKLPFCLRPCGSRYLLVGECYVHGLMNGEAMGTREQCEFAEECFEIA
ncbi:hypothetical protein K431DRAFT_283428 [Polychaeton citri CBS 116435]|uniref:Heterokaryon incompatibility domain-containing protein n=1 Tax=Polychaeton citri CBS 116435 TaxID=1314669 RepID=A0A9P4QBI4_9PEZI|nr:hypothetical protein K431DRAFT_283428 [Polychaeton citri CBS 116435]